jgi:hypothetical protein
MHSTLLRSDVCCLLRRVRRKAVVGWRRSFAADESTPPLGEDGLGSKLSKCHLVRRLFALVEG